MNEETAPDQPNGFWCTLHLHGQRPALIQADGALLSYADLLGLVDAAARPLPTDGKRLVLLGMRSDTASIVAYLACWRSGHAVMLVDPAQQALIQALGQAYQPDIDWLDTAQPPQQLRQPPQSAPQPLASDLALVVSTSGSSGSPKCVMLSRPGVQANTQAIVQYLGISPQDRALLTLPLHYVYGLSVLHAHLAAGASLIIGQHSLTQSATFELIDRLQATSFATVPLHFEQLERMGFRQQPHASLRCITQAGGKLAPDMVRLYAQWARQSGKQFVVMYGQTEASPRISWLPPQLAEQHPDAIGVPVPGGAIDIMDDDGRLVTQAGMRGELVYRGPNVMLGYASNRADLASPSRPQALATGDIGYRDAQGLFYIVGRRSRFAKLYGKRLSLDDIECALLEQGVPGHCVSDDQRLFVVTLGQPPSTPLLSDLAQRYQLAAHDLVGLALDAWPELSNGKIDLRSLLTWALATHGHASANAPGTPHPTPPAHPPRPAADAPRQVQALDPADTQARLLALYQASFPGTTVQASDSFESLHGDSLNFVVVSLGVEGILGQLPPGWSRLSIKALAGLQPATDLVAERRSPWRQLDTPVLLRALAPCMIIANHLGYTAATGGAALLLACAGWAMGRFQWHDLTGGRQGLILKKFVINVLLPYFALLLVSLMKNGTVATSHVLLAGNLVREESWIIFQPWFIQALAQILLATCALMALPRLGSMARATPWKAVIALLLLAMGLRGLDEYFAWDQNGESRQTSHVAWIYFMGMATSMADTQRRRWWLTAMALALPALFYTHDTPRHIVTSAGLLAMTWLPVVRVPGFTVRVLAAVASSSLFIYMTHFSVLKKLAMRSTAFDVLAMLLSLLIGVLCWHAYGRLQGWVRKPWMKQASAS